LVLVDDLAQHAGRVQAGHAGEVDGGLGVAGPLEHATLAVAQGEDVARAGQVAGAGGRVDERLDGCRTVGGGDARGGAVAVVDGDRERGALRLGVGAHHQRQLEVVEAIALQRDADHTRCVLQEEGDGVGGGELGGHDEVALVLPVLVVDHDDHLSPTDGGDGLLDVLQHVQPLASRRDSTYFAIASTSMLTRSPGPLWPRVVTSAVCGMTATVNECGSGLTTVRLHPSTVMEPFSTTKRRNSAGIDTSRSGAAARISPTASTWPCTMWPPRRSPTRTGRSRLTGSPGRRSPRLDRSRVSSTASAAHQPSPCSTTVRHTPFTAIDAPITASSVTS